MSIREAKFVPKYSRQLEILKEQTLTNTKLAFVYLDTPFHRQQSVHV